MMTIVAMMMVVIKIMVFTNSHGYNLNDQEPVVRKVDSAIHQLVVIFSNCLKFFIYRYKPD